MKWLALIGEIAGVLAAVIPMIIALIKYVQKASQEKNWGKLVDLLLVFMSDAEKLFSTGAERKEYVMLAIKASADKINYPIDMEVVSELIDNLVVMSKKVNPPQSEEIVQE